MSYLPGASSRHRPSSAVAVLAAFSLGVGTLGLSVPSASAADGSSSFAIPETTQSPDVVAASGSGIIIRIDSEDSSSYRVSNDSGATWADLGLSGFDDRYNAWAAAGQVVWVAEDNDGYAVQSYDFASGESSLLGQVADYPRAANQTVAVSAEWGDDDDDLPIGYQSLALDTGVSTRLAYRGHSASGDPSSRTFLASSADAVVAIVPESPGTGYLDLLPLSGAAGTSVKVSGLGDVEMSGDKLGYLTVTKSATSICFRSVSSFATAACRTVVKKDLRKAADLRLNVGPDWAVVTVERAYAADEQYVVAGTTKPDSVTKVTMPTGVAALNLVGAGDSPRPFAVVAKADEGYLARYGANGSLESIYKDTSTSNWIQDLVLTPGALYGSDERPTTDNPGYQAWSRSVSGTTVDEKESVFAARASGGLVASGARAVMATTSGVKLYDRGTLTRSLPDANQVLAISGGYYVDQTRTGTTSVRSIDGKQLLKGSVMDVFGSLALKWVKDGRYEVVDLAKVSKNVPFTAATGSDYLYGERLWGDWMVAQRTNDDDNTDDVLAYDYRTKTKRTRSGELYAVGDGFAIVQDWVGNEPQLLLWNYLTDTTQTLLADANDIERVTTDGSSRFAYVNETDVVVGALGSGVATSAPRQLGLVAASTFNNRPTSGRWTLDVDTTKPLAEGTLTILAKGKTVREITVPATADGSIRGLTWDGRDASNVAVPAGTYTWQLKVPAADGSGNLVRVDGSSGITDAQGLSGSVQVKPAYLGTVSGSTPKISDPTPTFGQKLTVKTGTWKPASTALAYQWYRDGKAISKDAGGSGSDYTVTLADLGHKLKVTVTGTADGWKTTAKTSSSTSKVASASLGAGRVSVDKPAPKVEETVTADPGTWTPDTTTFGYQWYRVVKGKATAIKGAIGQAYVVVDADEGAALKVTVTGTCPGYASKAASAQTAVVVQA